MTPETWMWLAVALCALISLTDPATRVKRWWRANLPNRTPSPGQQVVGVEGSTRAQSVQAAGGATGALDWIVTGPAEEVGQRGSEEGGPPTPSAAAKVLACGCEWVVDRPLEITPSVALGYYLSQASRAPEASA